MAAERFMTINASDVDWNEFQAFQPATENSKTHSGSRHTQVVATGR